MYVPNTLELYSSDIVAPLKVIRAYRGECTRTHRMATGCTGTAPESLLEEISGLPVTHVFTCDSKAASWQFIKANSGFDDDCHHFLDMHDLLRCRAITADGAEVPSDDPRRAATMITGRCARHEMMCCDLIMPKRLLDSFFAGISCKPYTMARTGRRAGTKDHEDAGLLETFVLLLAELQPGFAILQNVWGFCLPESRTVRESPLTRLLTFAAQVAPMYIPVVIIMQGTVFLHFVRRRVYVVFIHRDKGGIESVALLKLFITDSPFALI